ncbi:MAG: 3D domain-containing protein [bacterium]
MSTFEVLETVSAARRALIHGTVARVLGAALATILVLDPCVSSEELAPAPFFEEWLMTHPIDVAAKVGRHRNTPKATPVAARRLDPLLEGIPVTMTAYSSDVAQTDADPHITATGTTVRPGVIALSRDLLRDYTPGAPFRYGDRVFIEGHGEFIVEDTMHPRWTHRVDLWSESREEAVQFGRRRGRLHAVPNPKIAVVRVDGSARAGGLGDPGTALLP